MLSRIESLEPEGIDREVAARIDLQTQKEIILKDKFARALAILHNCRILSGTKTPGLFSAMLPGGDLGLIKRVTP